MPEDVQVAVICPDFVPGVFRAVPLIEHFLDYVFVFIDSEADRSFISYPSRVALDLHPHISRIVNFLRFSVPGRLPFATTTTHTQLDDISHIHNSRIDLMRREVEESHERSKAEKTGIHPD